MSGEEWQAAGSYPADFTLAALPVDVAPYNCDHDAGFCLCVHDWRINWGNLNKRSQPKATYIQ